MIDNESKLFKFNTWQFNVVEKIFLMWDSAIYVFTIRFMSQIVTKVYLKDYIYDRQSKLLAIRWGHADATIGWGFI